MTDPLAPQADVVVIGGGVVGACVALSAVRAGRQVLLVERGEVCGAASSGNACWVATSHSTPTAAPGVIGEGLRYLLDPGSPFSIRPRPSMALLRWLWSFRRACNDGRVFERAETLLALSRRSHELFRSLRDELGFAFVEQGLLHVQLSDETRRAAAEDAELFARLGIEAVLLDRDGALEYEPRLQPDVRSAMYTPELAHLDPVEFTEAVMGRAVAEGAVVRERVSVDDVRVDDGRIRSLTTSAGTVEPTDVVLAAGAWSEPLARMLGAPILMQPAKGYSVTVRRRSPEQGPSRPMMIDDGRVAVTPLPGGRFRFSSTLELAGFDPSVNDRRLAVNRDALQRVLPDMDELDAAPAWSGYRPLTADTLPYIGRSERVANLVFATGHGMLGLTQAPGTGELVAQVLTGQPTSMPLAPMSPDRG